MRPRMAVGGCQLAGRNTTRTTHPRHPISILYLAVASIPVEQPPETPDTVTHLQ